MTNVRCQSSTQVDCIGTCTPEHVVTSDKRNSTLKALARVKSFLEGLLKVRQVAGNLVFIAQTCGREGGVAVPALYRSPGIANTDLVVFVTMRPSSLPYAYPTYYYTWSIECHSDSLSWQPRGAQLNINPAVVNTFPEDNLFLALVHEMIHVLAFS